MRGLATSGSSPEMIYPYEQTTDETSQPNLLDSLSDSWGHDGRKCRRLIDSCLPEIPLSVCAQCSPTNFCFLQASRHQCNMGRGSSSSPRNPPATAPTCHFAVFQFLEIRVLNSSPLQRNDITECRPPDMQSQGVCRSSPVT